MAKVLIAVDGSDFSKAGARRGVQLLAPDGQFVVLCVVPVIATVASAAAPGFAVGPVVDPALMEEADQARTTEARAAAEAAVAELGVTAVARLEHGEPSAVICDVAALEGFDLIVMASHGAGFLKRALLGSVTDHVMHHAPCPVLVVRERHDRHDRH
jgi:nucleotide-binding universal stress UspA family protein